MTILLNVFNQYVQEENRLTHALGVTLSRSRKFQAAFLKKLAGNPRLRRKTEIRLQLAGGVAEYNGEKCGIPDLAIIDDQNNAVIAEVKLGANLTASQLASHENRIKRDGLNVVSALAVTGRDRDQKSVGEWISRKKLNHAWRHVSWQQIYQLACDYAVEDPWAEELRDYMLIMAKDLDENKMEADVKIIDFTGIPGDLAENYSHDTAKRVLHSLMDELRSDKAFLKALHLPENPRAKKAIKKTARVWDVLSPVGDKGDFVKSHHFTVNLGSDLAGAMLTIPHRSFTKLRRHVKSVTPEQFGELLAGYVKELGAAGILKANGSPYIVMLQRRYKNMQLYATDGQLEFDLRTLTGLQSGKAGPGIKRQPKWLNFCHDLIANGKGNLQFQIGVRFPYETCPSLRQKRSINLFKDAFRATVPFAREVGYV